LHQKELVLNKEDTENMLNAVQILRNITDSFSTSMLSKIASLDSSLNTGSFNTDQNNGIEQNVVINADFPNATNSKEIENALNNLVNVASQRAGRG
jgi:hypothetical protein